MSRPERELRTVADIFTAPDCRLRKEMFPFPVMSMKGIKIRDDYERKGPPLIIVTLEDSREVFIYTHRVGYKCWQISLAKLIGVPKSDIEQYGAKAQHDLREVITKLLRGLTVITDSNPNQQDCERNRLLMTQIDDHLTSLRAFSIASSAD